MKKSTQIDTSKMRKSTQIDTTKMKKSTRSKDAAEAAAAAVADYGSACPPKKKTKKKQKSSVWTTDVAAGAAAGHAFSSFLKENKEEKKAKEKKIGKAKKMKKMKADEAKKIGKVKKMPYGNEDPWPLLYLVIGHDVKCPAYSLYKVNFRMKTAGDRVPVPPPCRIKYLDAEHDMSFAAVNSEQRSWIVGVGGHEDQPNSSRGETIVFDCKAETVAKGPRPMASKFSPVVVTIGEKVYALSCMPSIWLEPDLPPWFEVLDLSVASCVNGQLTNCSWCPLPYPPLFPILNEEGTRVDLGPPIVEVESYAVVGNFILLSIVRDPYTERGAGTVAFDVYDEEWHYVDRERNLPFIGQAVPSGHFFLGRSRLEGNELTGYSISVTKTNSSLMLSIVEVPSTGAMVNIPQMISGKFFSPMGNGVICSVDCCIHSWDGDEDQERDNICIDVYGPINVEEDDAELQRAGKIVPSSNHSFFRLEEPVYKLIAPTLVSALWMDVV